MRPILGFMLAKALDRCSFGKAVLCLVASAPGYCEFNRDLTAFVNWPFAIVRSP